MSPAKFMATGDPESCIELKAILDHQELHPFHRGHHEHHKEAESAKAATEHSEVGVCLIHMMLPPLG